MKTDAQQYLNKIQQFSNTRPIRILNVCGGHERTIANGGLRSILPQNIQLIPGPGCPVCVCPNEVINQAIKLAQADNIILACFGDMVNVPVNNKKGDIQSLAEARALGANVFPVASPQEVIHLAQNNPDKTIVFFVAGFETTMAPIAAMLSHNTQNNIKYLIAGRKTWPIVSDLLASGDHNLDGIIAPGHVATIMGSKEWDFVPKQFDIPCVIAGFTTDNLLKSIYELIIQILNDNVELKNCYPQMVKPHGNALAQKTLKKYFQIYDATWRGIGLVKQSGYQFKPAYQHLDAANILPQNIQPINKSDLPASCDCAQVVMGKQQPTQCKLFNKPCTPKHPIGPCMVSDEGACHIWWQNGEQLKHDLPYYENA